MQLGTYYTGEKYSSNFGHNTDNSFFKKTQDSVPLRNLNEHFKIANLIFVPQMKDTVEGLHFLKFPAAFE